MAGKQQTMRLHQWCEALQDFPLSGFVEINHHIAAENCVERLLSAHFGSSRLSCSNFTIAATSGRIRTLPACAPEPFRKKRLRRAGDNLLTCSIVKIPAAPLASTCVSISVATTLAAPARLPSASINVIAIEYGSSPVDAAEHQTVRGWGHVLACSASTGKWWASRKNAVRLVVNALVNNCHSSPFGSASRNVK